MRRVTGNDGGSGSGIRTLIVDDELVSREKLRTIMERHGECVTAANGVEAMLQFVEAWEAWRPFDLIMLDIGLPDRTGKELLQEMRRMEAEHGVAEHHRARIAIVTSATERSTVAECVAAGCDDYIIKPISAAIIGRKVEAMGLAG